MTTDHDGGGTFERSFVLSVEKERAWQCFTDPAESSAWLASPDAGTDDHYTTAGGTAGYRVVVNEVVAHERLRWTEEHAEPAGSVEICVVFEDDASGCRICITRARFGAIDDAHWEAGQRGWDEAIADLAFYLRTGIRARRHFSDRGATAFMGRDTLAGVEVAHVFPDGFGAQAGLRAGDLLLDLGGAAIFTMSDVWALLREHGAGARLPVRYVRGTQLMGGEGSLSDPAHFPQ